MEDSRELGFSLFNAGAISKSRLIELMEPPMKELLLDDIKKADKNTCQAQNSVINDKKMNFLWPDIRLNDICLGAEA